MIVCPSSKCGSPNRADLPHCWLSWPAESLFKALYAPPPQADGGYLAAAAVVLGIVASAGGAALPGVPAALGGLRWGALVHHWLTLVAAWDSSRVYLACAGRF
ncbi:hypothetical protein [Streptomyces longwoodensis]|uniref:hypothetical protein n=1 Tax=Streptomyces longwoodensis TaxID=68231 RepID=UPI003403F6E0